MTVARRAQVLPNVAAPEPVSARLDLLLRHAITVDQFDADVAQACKRDPEEVWSVLALLDQYHRLGKLPDELFRTLKSFADRRGFARGGLHLPEPEPQSVATTAAATTAAAAPLLAPIPVPATVPVLSPPAAAVTRAPEIRVGSVLCGHYLLEAELASDHRGPIYQALDQRRVDQSADVCRVALQILHRSVANAAVALAEVRQEFRDAQRLVHPNIISVHELALDGACILVTMDLVPGEPLSALLARRQGRALPRAAALAIIRDVGAALVYAHERGVVHGDLHPSNIVISSTGEVRVRGFGAVRAHSNYASCEQLEQRPADRRDDLYALACISYELLHGSPPFGLLNAAAARGRALVPPRPLLLTRTQWQTLRIGLAWRRENRTVGVAWWLARMRLGRAARRLPALETLATLPSLRRPWWRPLLLTGLLAAAVATAASLDRLPDRAALASGWTELRGFAQQVPGLVQRLGDWLSPMASPAMAGAETLNSAVSVQRPAPPRSKKKRLAAIDRVADAPAITPQVTASKGDTVAAPDAVAAAEPAPAPARIELSADNYTVMPGESAARIRVQRRGGNLRGDVSFVWWTESASARPERDYIDWGRRAEQIPAGRSSVTLLIPIVSDALRRESRLFYVAIGAGGGSAELGDNARAAILMPGGR
jgi:serine/threonine protein kinase